MHKKPITTELTDIKKDKVHAEMHKWTAEKIGETQKLFTCMKSSRKIRWQCCRCNSTGHTLFEVISSAGLDLLAAIAAALLLIFGCFSSSSD